MPPPPDIPPTSGSEPRETNSTPSPTLTRRDAGSSTRARFPKSAGFRPIGLASSSVKMFFPRDDEELEEEVPLIRRELPSRPEVPSKRTYEDVRTNQDEDSLRPIRKPCGIPALSQEVASESKGVIIDPRPASPVTHDGPKPRLMEPEVDGATRPSSPSVTSRKELYAIVSQVGEGTFGKVYKARNTITNVHVALKRIRMEVERDGFPVTAMREIKLLQSLRHQNVVRLYEMMVSNGSVFMVFEYMDHDLTGVLSQTQFSFSEANLKSLCSQMLAGLAYLHHKGVIHRDIKGSNILINNRGELKLADFGLARFYQKRRRSDYTNRVITLWYRPPELLFGATVYGPEVDMWSAGCIMLELFTKKPIFQGNDEIHQLDVIYRIFGTPTPERWPGITELPWFELVKPKEVIQDHFRELFQRWLSPAALDLAEQLLTYDPAKRVTAVQALDAPYFKEELPPPELPVGLSSLEGEWHELETKRERAKKRRKLESGTQPQPV
ncbi:Pkinase-domain-containing protein [Gyrodon lividus]|nr:Pkinase-domain-containing protein [Gyrodon lividus]